VIKDDFAASLGCLTEPALARLAARLSDIEGLGSRECATVVAATRESLIGALHGKLGRLLLLELNAARVTGRLDAEDSAQRWQQFSAMSSRLEFWHELVAHYPSLLKRVDRIVEHRCEASLRFARRWASDRTHLASLCGDTPGELLELAFGAGDSHRGAETVALLRTEGGRLVYKPRSLAVDIALGRFIADLVVEDGIASTMQVPRAIAFSDYGWTEFVTHRYAKDDAELRDFYRSIGHWLALMHILGGSDLHAENLIAAGPSPIVTDCETLFTPMLDPRPSGLGHAYDQAAELLRGNVMGIGLLPSRAQGLGWRGVDNSGIGMLRGEQPLLPQPQIAKAGTDEAHLGMAMVEAPIAQNHPSREPVLARFWPEVLHGFDEMAAHLRRLDASGRLEQRLDYFADCRVRVVVRHSEAYAELGRMLWHPVSLHQEGPARQRAYDLLKKMADNMPIAPGDPAVIEAELDDLIDGDIPYFDTLARLGELEGPGGSRWLARRNLIEASLNHWRAADLQLQRNIVQAALVSAYIGDGLLPDEDSLLPKQVRGGQLDHRRRYQAETILRQIAAQAIHGEDGSVAWIAPVAGATSWSMQPIEQDLYNGISGIAVLVAAYLRETAAKRANPVEGLDLLLTSILHTLDLAEASRQRLEGEAIKLRPRLPGGFVGLGSQIWTWIILAQWGIDESHSLKRACSLADHILEAAAADTTNDLLAGTAGAIPPLLALANATKDSRYLTIACQLGDMLCERARRRDNAGIYWSDSRWPEGVGGFSHGATGMGWALSKLARASGKTHYQETADAAFAFEHALFDADAQNWIDLRKTENAATTAAWCNGAIGIGLAHMNLDPSAERPSTRLLLRRAASATWRFGIGLDHCLCHGDFSAWELLEHAIAAGEAPEGLTSAYLKEMLLTGLEDHGPRCGLSRDIFMPGLMTGVGGVAYQLLRMHPDSQLPSVLTLEH